MACAVVNPRQVRDLAKATGQLAKTDTLDATTLAHFGEVIRPDLRSIEDADLQALDALITRRRQLVGMLTAEQNRLPMASAPTRKDILQHITWLKKRLKDIDEQTARRIKESPLRLAKDRLLPRPVLRTPTGFHAFKHGVRWAKCSRNFSRLSCTLTISPVSLSTQC